MFTAQIVTPDSIDAAEGTIVLKLAGEAGFAGMPDLERATAILAAQRPSLVVIDCHGLTFMASLAMGSLVALQGALKRSGSRVVIASPPKPILDLIQRARLDSVFPIYESVETALTAFAGAGS